MALTLRDNRSTTLTEDTITIELSRPFITPPFILRRDSHAIAAARCATTRRCRDRARPTNDPAPAGRRREWPLASRQTAAAPIAPAHRRHGHDRRRRRGTTNAITSPRRG